MKRFENLEEAMCKELEMLNKKYSEPTEMSVQDLEKADKLYHTLKSAETYYAMVDAGGWEDKDASGRSYRRGRDAMGRYASRNMAYGYPDGGYSGHYPEWMPPYYR